MSINPLFSSPAERRQAMSAMLAQNWWALALRGALAILFGVLTFLLPGVTLLTLVYLFAGYLIVDGVLAIIAAVRAANRHERWGFLVLEGVVDFLAALAAAFSPDIAIVFFIYLIAVWSIVSGAFMTAAAFRLHGGHGGWMLALAGIFSVVFGILLIVSPVAGALVLAYWIGAYAIVFGALLIAFSVRLRGRRVPAGGAPLTPGTP
jgi:uncharacterized membrane protein HdeD (DUF308 family)